MEIIREKRCVIGEGPIWNERDGLLYYVNAMGNREICTLDPITLKTEVYGQSEPVSAMAFTKDGRMIASRPDGVVFLNMYSSEWEYMYDPHKYRLLHCNDAKVGPDGRLYVGTQSEKRLKISDRVDGRLYRIDSDGQVKVLLDGLILSNGMDWSMDGKFFYHVDSGTKLVSEYRFYAEEGSIEPTGRAVFLKGADGLTVSTDGYLLVACWGQAHVAVVDASTMEIASYIELPAPAPASCGFFGSGMDMLAITTASYGVDVEKHPESGYLMIHKSKMKGRTPYLFG